MLTKNRNTDEYLLKNFLDDRSLINAVSTNKELLKKGEEIFKERLRSNYPHLYKKKPFLESYRNYYLKMMYYIGKLKEELDVDYIPVPSFDPEGAYRGLKKLKNYPDVFRNYLISYYTELGDESKIREIAKSYTEKYGILWDLIICRNIALYEKLKKEWDIEIGPLYLSMAAAASGSKELVDSFNKLPLANFEVDINGRKHYAMLGAASAGSLDLLEYINDLFPDNDLNEENFSEILWTAAENGHSEFVRSFLTNENYKFLLKNIPEIIFEIITSTKADFLSEAKLKQILGMMMDYYFENGGDKKKFFKKIPSQKLYSKIDPNISEFINSRLDEY